MKFLVTGKNGQVGTALQQVALPDGVELCALGRDELDIANAQQAISTVAEISPQVVINCRSE